MKPTYVPIIKAKQGELEALTKLSGQAKIRIIPFFDIPRLDQKTRQKLISVGELPIESFLNKVANDIANAWVNGQIYLDLPHWAPNALTENGEHVLPYIFNRLNLLNIDVNPVIDYVRWNDFVYSTAIKSIDLGKNKHICIRIPMDYDTLEEMNEPDYFLDQIYSIPNALEMNPDDATFFIDFGDIFSQKNSIEFILDKSNIAINLLQNNGFTRIMYAGCSMPEFITAAVKAQNTTALLMRKEMIIWQSILSSQPGLDITFSDYCIRSPKSTDEAVPNPGNGKIRYTVNKHYFITRGYPLNHGMKGAQHYSLAKTIINSEHYYGANYSWGDRRIFDCSEEKFKGRPQDWIAIDTNHHIESVLSEVLEFQENQLHSKSKAAKI